MKCWAIRKVLAIYVGKDLPFFNRSIEKHLKVCSACSKVYRQYKHKKQILRNMKTPKISPELFENFWEEISDKIQTENNSSPKINLSLAWERYKIILMPISILIAIVLGLWIYSEQGTGKEYRSNLSPSLKIIKNLHQKQNTTSPSKKNNLNEYELDQVQPHNLRDASFQSRKEQNMPYSKRLILTFIILNLIPNLYSQPIFKFEKEFINLIQQNKPLVVSIELYNNKKNLKKKVSGVIFDKRGYIITVASTLKEIKKIYVRFESGDVYKAYIVGIDNITNLAVIKISCKNLPSIKRGDSDKLKLGAFLITIGNPYGLTKSVATGIVSGLNRTVCIKNSENYLTGLIQTTSPINPGDAGGLVIDSKGRFVGMICSTLANNLNINNQIESFMNKKLLFNFLYILKQLEREKKVLPNKFEEIIKKIPDIRYNSKDSHSPIVSQGINFILPSKTIYWVAEQIIKERKVKRGWVGITVGDICNKKGVIIKKIEKNSPARKKRLMLGDIITKINGKAVKDTFSLLHKIYHTKINETIKFTILRKDKIFNVDIILSEKK